MSLLENKKASFNYEIIEKYEAGIELLGGEVKSLRGSHGSLDGAYISVRGNELFLIGSFIPPYQPTNTPEGYDPYRIRRILLTRKEISELTDKHSRNGLTIIPLSVYNKRKVIKLSIALVKSKKKYDKREIIKKREDERNIRREFKVR